MKNIINIQEIAKKIGLHNVLTFRPLGKEAKAIVLEEIRRAEPGDIIELDFTDIRSCDVSFVDEMIIEVVLWEKAKSNILLYISNYNEDIIDNLEAALALREQKHGDKVQILTKENNVFGFVGSLEHSLKETFRELINRNEITARDIAASFELEINSASNRLKKVYDAGLCLRREMIDEHGKQHVYYLPKERVIPFN